MDNKKDAMAVLRLNDAKISSGAVRVYVSFVRGTPIILQILLLYSLLPSVLNTIVQTLGINFNVFDAIDPFFYAVVVFSLNTIALLSEVFRSALISISKGQLEAGLSIGLTRFQVYIHDNAINIPGSKDTTRRVHRYSITGSTAAAAAAANPTAS